MKCRRLSSERIHCIIRHEGLIPGEALFRGHRKAPYSVPLPRSDGHQRPRDHQGRYLLPRRELHGGEMQVQSPAIGCGASTLADLVATEASGISGLRTSQRVSPQHDRRSARHAPASLTLPMTQRSGISKPEIGEHPICQIQIFDYNQNRLPEGITKSTMCNFRETQKQQFSLTRVSPVSGDR